MSGSPGIIDQSRREVQRITLRANEGAYFEGGTFRLSFNYEGVNDLDFQTVSKTGHIPFNATAAQMKTALESLEKITLVEVRREGPDDQGAYSWKVTLDWDQDFRGDLPMLVASEEHFDVSYSGTGGVVSIVEEQKGFIGQEVCTSHCMHEVSGLSPSTEYHFRVRAINGAGVGPFSGISEPIRTHRLGPPLRTSTPLISSVGTDFIVVQVPIPDANGVDPSELVIELQFRPILAVSQPVPVAWTTLPPARVLYDNERVVTITANGLRPLTQYELRARAISPLGEGQWSHATMAVKTRPNPPPPPQVFTPTKSDVHDREVTIHWSADMPVFRDGLYRPFDIATEQPPIESFDIEYRVSGDRWIRVSMKTLAILLVSVLTSSSGG